MEKRFWDMASSSFVLSELDQADVPYQAAAPAEFFLFLGLVTAVLIGKTLVWGSFFDSTEITHSSVIIARTHLLSEISAQKARWLVLNQNRFQLPLYQNQPHHAF